MTWDVRASPKGDPSAEKAGPRGCEGGPLPPGWIQRSFIHTKNQTNQQHRGISLTETFSAPLLLGWHLF